MSETLTKRSLLMGGVFAAAAVVTGPLTGTAQAQERGPIIQASTDAPTSITREEELEGLKQAERDASDLALAGFNVGMVLHVGDDILLNPNLTIKQVADHFRDLYQAELDARYPGQNGTVEVYPRLNPGGKSSLISISIGDQLFEVDNEKYGRTQGQDSALLDLRTADEAKGDVLQQLPTAKAIQLRNEGNDRTASLDGVAPG